MRTQTVTTQNGEGITQETVKTLTADSPNSVEVSRNAKGQFSFVVKVYHDDDEHADAVARVAETYTALLDTFKSEG